MQSVHPSPSKNLSILLLLLAAGLIALFLWALHRGFDITDEGLYLLGYDYPAEYSSSSTSFHLMIPKLLPSGAVTIIGYRLASLACALSAAILFGWAFCRWSLHRFGAAAAPLAWVLPLFVIGTLVQYAVLPRTIYYNSLNSLAIAVFASAVLYYEAARDGRALALLVLGGLAMGLDGFVKATSAVAVLGSGVLVLLLTVRGPLLARLRPLVAIGVGGVLSIMLFGLLIKPLPLWFTDLRHETEVLLRTTYGAGLLVRYFADAYPIIRTLVYPFGVVAALAAAWLYYQGRGLNAWWQHVAVLGAVVLLLAFEAHRTGLYKNAHLNFNRSATWPLGAMLVGIAMLLAAYRRYSQPVAETRTEAPAGWRAWLVPLWLLVLPLASAFGTWNQIFINVLLEVMYWIAILVILYQLMPAPARQLRGVRLALLAAPAIMLTQQAAYGVLWAPYLLVENMFSQQVPLKVGAPFKEADLLVDAPTAQYIGELRTAVRGAGFRTGDPILAMYDAPGLVYALGGIAPGNPWYFGQQDARNCDALAKNRRDLSRAFLFINETPGPEMLACMAEHGLQFPAGFRLIYQGISPYSRNQYKWRSYQDTVRVYAPATLAPAAAPVR